MEIEHKLMALTNGLNALLEAQAKENSFIRERFAELTTMQRKNEARFEKNEARFEQIAQRFENLGAFVHEVAEGTARLLNTAQAHEQRISDLEEGNRPQL
jgi:chromosome segregation ATPase